MARQKGCYLTVADEDGTVLLVIDDLEQYDLTRTLARADLCCEIQAAIEAERAKREAA